MQIGKTRADRVFDAINVLIMAGIIVVTIYPLYFTIIASFSDPYEVVRGHVIGWPMGFTLEAYTKVLREVRLWYGYRNSLVYTSLGVVLNLLLTIPAAYVLSKKRLPGRNALATYFIIPMYFSGGLIPTYLQVKDLGLLNRPYTLIVLGGLSVYYVIVTRVYFETSIEETIYESARIDGACELRMFASLALPLSAPILAVMSLFYAVGRWNDYYTALIYVSTDRYLPLQMILRSILTGYESGLSLGTAQTALTIEEVEAQVRAAYLAQVMKYSLIFISSLPLLLAYPFCQKYFIKGMMIGSLKG